MKLTHLKRLREEAALTQEELGAKAGLAAYSISEIEHGRDARPSTARKLAKALGCQPKDLMEKEQTQP